MEIESMDIQSIRRDQLVRIVDLEHAGNRASFARRAKKPPSQINDLLHKRKSFGEKLAREMERNAGLDSLYFDTMNGMNNSDEIESGKLHIPGHVVQEVPCIGWLNASNFQDMNEPFAADLVEDWIPTRGKKFSRHVFALIVEGDSMVSANASESFLPGTALIVDPGRTPVAGDFIIAKDEQTGAATFKRLMHDGGRWFLRPTNPAYSTAEIEDVASVTIGVIVKAMLDREF